MLWLYRPTGKRATSDRQVGKLVGRDSFVRLKGHRNSERVLHGALICWSPFIDFTSDEVRLLGGADRLAVLLIASCGLSEIPMIGACTAVSITSVSLEYK